MYTKNSNFSIYVSTPFHLYSFLSITVITAFIPPVQKYTQQCAYSAQLAKILIDTVGYVFYLHLHKSRPLWICFFSLPLFPPLLFADFQRSDFMPPKCFLMASFPFLASCWLPTNVQQEKCVHVFTILALFVLLKLVACMHAQTHTNSHWDALKWKKPQALYLLYIIHPPQHIQRMTDTHSRNTQRGENRKP